MTLTFQRISIALSDLEKTREERVHDKQWDSTEIDVIVVGSGYGGAIAAARLAEAGQKVCLLERGREILPGHYPTDLKSAIRETQVTTAESGKLKSAIGGDNAPNPNGMLDIRINKDMNVIVGCGLGGTSLINANVSLETDPKTFWQTTADGEYYWPKEFRQKCEEGDRNKDKDQDKYPNILAKYYASARKMLGATPLPEDFNPNKLQALKVSADALQQPFHRPDINVTFKDGPNAAGVEQVACTMCGDCCAGCNYGAKNTTLMNYLPYARSFHAILVTEAQVTHLSPPVEKGGSWNVHIEDLSTAGGSTTLTAKTVVLGAGTLGSTEILLRSRNKLRENNPDVTFLSDKLGTRFSGNGDVLGFAFDANWSPEARAAGNEREPIWGVGAGANYPLSPAEKGENSILRPGPCITGVIKVGMGEDEPVERAAVIEEGVAPGALSLVYPAIFLMQEALHGQMTRFPDAQLRLEDAQDLGTAILSGSGLSTLAYTGAMSRTQSFLLMSHDSSGGTIDWNTDHQTVEVNWPGVGTEFPYNRDNKLLHNASDAIWGNYLANPLWHENFGHQLITVHPVGGCIMGDDATRGVVDHECRVFTGNPDDSSEVYQGFYVCDGSVMPTSLGLNPLLTISAVTERAMENLIKRLGQKHVAHSAVNQPVKKPVPGQTSFDGWNLAVKGLAEAKIWLTDLQQKIKDEKTSDAAEQIYNFAKEVNDKFDLGYGDYLGPFEHYLKHSYELSKDIAPAIVEILGVLDPVLEAAGDNPGDYAELVVVLQRQLGNFAPDLKFDETMTGHVSAATNDGTGILSDPYKIAAKRGQAQNEKLVAHFKVATKDIEVLTACPKHLAQLGGTIEWKGVTYTISNGTFKLLKLDKADVETWQMIYTCDMLPDGATTGFGFKGVKTLHRRDGSNWWTDLTTLAVDISDANGPVARGVITLGMQDFLAQLATLTSEFDPKLDKYDGKNVFTKLMLDCVPEPLGYGGIRYGILNEDLKKPDIRRQIILSVVDMALNPVEPITDNKERLKAAAEYTQYYYQLKFAAFFGELIFRTYGGMLAYLYNFPSRDKITPLPAVSGASLRNLPEVISEWHPFKAAPGFDLQMVRYNGSAQNKGPAKCPVILAPGFGVVAQSYVMETMEENIVESLCKEGYDVWLFDYRASPALGKTNQQPFNVDDIAQEDWPAAVDYVLKATGAKQVQTVVHCVGSMSMLMALLSGKLDASKIRSIVSSQLTVHPVTNWFNKLKADTKMASWIVNGVPKSLYPVLDSVIGPDTAKLFEGMKTINATSVVDPNCGTSNEDQALNVMLWGAPFPNGTPCYSPTCHRIFGIYGPSYLHQNLNEATHDAIQTVFGEIGTTPFEQIALITRKGYAVSASGEDIYIKYPERLRVPIHFIAGALNLEFTPDTSLHTYEWLRTENPDYENYSRQVFADYGHMDTFIGKRAYKDIFPAIIHELNKYPATQADKG
ncbi:GMC oxidoreductase [Aliiroseovarius sp. KMU-50]|uniref:Cholesterol oxidase n=1 Tax=Aliiroseovarius salicola TaxID=3009082 RepID=A0ABT4W2T5_9RHOB|nr:alpha/beta fold hydrolase [Aliiroseovarius sp. KMU-50]MDA5094824.1 GMC oxidoreductase [Aliiroseovarius sp. KMU-50]